MESRCGVICSSPCNIVYCKDRKKIACGGLDCIFIRNISTGFTDHFFRVERDGKVNYICTFVRHDEEYIAAGFESGSIHIWNITRNEPFVTFNGHESSISCLKIDNSSDILASGSSNGEIILWDLSLESGKCRFSEHKSMIIKLEFLGDSTLVSHAKDNYIKFWDLAGEFCFESLSSESVCFNIFDMESKNHLITFDNGLLKIFELNDLKIQSPLSSNEALIKLKGSIKLQKSKIRSSLIAKNLIIVHDGNKSFSIYRINAVRDMIEIVYQTAIHLEKKITSFDTLITGDQLLLLCALQDNCIEECSFSLKEFLQLKRRCIDYEGHRNDIIYMCWTIESDSEIVVASLSKDSIIFWNFATEKIITKLQHKTLHNMIFIPESKIVIAGTDDGKLISLNWQTNETLFEVEAHQGLVTGLVHKSDGEFFTSGVDKFVKLWKVSAKNGKIKMLKMLQLHDAVSALAIAKDHSFICVALFDLTIKVFYEDTFKLHLSLIGHKLTIGFLYISEDSKTLFSSSSDKTIKMWDLKFGECRKSIIAHGDSVNCINFYPERNYLITASKDKKIKIWNMSTFDCVSTIRKHYSDVCYVMSIKNKLVSCSRDKSIHWYPIDALDEIDEVPEMEEMENEEADLSRMKLQYVEDLTIFLQNRIELKKLEGQDHKPEDKERSYNQHFINLLQKLDFESMRNILIGVSSTSLEALLECLILCSRDLKNLLLMQKVFEYISTIHFRLIVQNKGIQDKANELSLILKSHSKNILEILEFNHIALSSHLS